MGNRSARAVTWLASIVAVGIWLSACSTSGGGVHAQFYLQMSQAYKALNVSKEPARAEKLYLQAVAEVEHAPTSKGELSELQKNVMLTEGWEALANCYSIEGKNDLAAATFKKRVDLAQQQAGAGRPLPASLLSRYEELLRKAGKTAEADALKERIKQLPAEGPDGPEGAAGSGATGTSGGGSSSSPGSSVGNMTAPPRKK